MAIGSKDALWTMFALVFGPPPPPVVDPSKREWGESIVVPVMDEDERP